MDMRACTGWDAPRSPGEAYDLSCAYGISRFHAEHVQMRALGEQPVPVVNYNLIAKIRGWRRIDIDDATIGCGNNGRAHRRLYIDAFMFSPAVAGRAKRAYPFVGRVISGIERAVIWDRPKFEWRARCSAATVCILSRTRCCDGLQARNRGPEAFPRSEERVFGYDVYGPQRGGLHAGPRLFR